MRKFDILSQSPTNYIFQKESNKTTFGGFLSILFILIIVLIFLLYRFQFWFHFLYWERYEITSYVSQEKILTEYQKDKFTQSIYYNPSLLLNFSLSNSNDDTLSDRFIFYDYLKKNILKVVKLSKEELVKLVSLYFISVIILMKQIVKLMKKILVLFII